MTPYYADASVQLFHGDCLDVLRELPDASVDAVVTDPPYGLEFMGREWDGADGFRRSLNRNDVDRENVFGRTPRTSPEYRALHTFQDWCQEWATECLRVLKPGGHILAFGGSRTWHRLTAAIEDAGFEIRDSIAWLYGSGFPKSLDVSKAIDKANGRRFEDRYALGRHIRERRTALGLTQADVNAWFGYRDGCQHWERQDASGARVPSLSDYAVLRERLGLRDDWLELVERCEAEREVVSTKVSNRLAVAPGQGMDRSALTLDITTPATPDAERWQGWGTALKPAFEPIVVARKPLAGTVAANVLTYGTGALNVDGCRIGTDQRVNPPAGNKPGGAALNMSAVGMPQGVEPTLSLGRWPANVVLDESQAAELDRQRGTSTSRIGKPRGAASGDGWGMTATGTEYDDLGGASRFFPTFHYEPKAPTHERPREGEVAHPTVKPLDLMRWLVRLVTPPGGTVLEPFAGSGTTAEACVIEGFKCIAIEREADYLPLIVARLTKPIQVALDFDGVSA